MGEKIKLSDYGARIDKGALVLSSVNDSNEVTYRALHGQRVPYMATGQQPRSGETMTIIQRDGEAMTMDAVRAQLRLDGPVAYWLKNYTLVDVQAAMCNTPSSDRAYLKELDHAAQSARQISILPIDVGFDVRVQNMIVSLQPELTKVTYDDAGKIAIVIGGQAEIEDALTAAGYQIQWSTQPCTPINAVTPKPSVNVTNNAVEEIMKNEANAAVLEEFFSGLASCDYYDGLSYQLYVDTRNDSLLIHQEASDQSYLIRDDGSLLLVRKVSGYSDLPENERYRKKDHLLSDFGYADWLDEIELEIASILNDRKIEIATIQNHRAPTGPKMR